MRIAAKRLELIADSLAELSRCEHLDFPADVLERAQGLLAFRSFGLRDFRAASEVREAVERGISGVESRLVVPLISLLVRTVGLCDLVGPRF